MIITETIFTILNDKTMTCGQVAWITDLFNERQYSSSLSHENIYFAHFLTAIPNFIEIKSIICFYLQHKNMELEVLTTICAFIFKHR